MSNSTISFFKLKAQSLKQKASSEKHKAKSFFKNYVLFTNNLLWHFEIIVGVRDPDLLLETFAVVVAFLPYAMQR